MKTYWISRWSSFLKEFTESPIVYAESMCFVFRFGHLRYLHVGKLKLVEEFTVKHLSSDKPEAVGTVKRKNHFRKSECGSFVNVIYRWKLLKVCELPENRYYFTKTRIFNGSNALFTSNVPWVMLEEKDYYDPDRTFPFVAMFYARNGRHVRTASLTTVQTRYSQIVCDVAV